MAGATSDRITGRISRRLSSSQPLRSFVAAALVLFLGCFSPAFGLQSITVSSRYYYVSSKTKGVRPSPYTGSFRVSVKMTEFSQLVQYTLRVFGLPGKPKATFSDVGIFKGTGTSPGTLVTTFPCRAIAVMTGWVCFGEARTTLDKSWTPKVRAAALIKAGVYDTPGNFYVNVTYSGATSASGGASGTVIGTLTG